MPQLAVQLAKIKGSTKNKEERGTKEKISKESLVVYSSNKTQFIALTGDPHTPTL